MEPMSWQKIVGITFGICLPIIALIEFMSRWRKRRVQVTKELYHLDQVAKTCATFELENVWQMICKYDDEARMTNTQMMKMATILAYMQGRREQLKHDTALSKDTGSQAAGAPAPGQPAH